MIVEISPKWLLTVAIVFFAVQDFGAICTRIASYGVGTGIPILGGKVLILRCVLLFDDLQFVE